MRNGNKGKHDGRGRPTIMNEDTLRKLDEAFMRGLSDRQACLYADIGETTLYDYQKENPDYPERKKLLKENTKMKARLLINLAIDTGDLDAGKWYLERRDEEFKPKSQSEHIGAVPVQVNVTKEEISEAIQELDQLKG